MRNRQYMSGSAHNPGEPTRPEISPSIDIASYDQSTIVQTTIQSTGRWPDHA
jgi:hypothetical protein